jgi:hypothetical protein
MPNIVVPWCKITSDVAQPETSGCLTGCDVGLRIELASGFRQHAKARVASFIAAALFGKDRATIVSAIQCFVS